VPASRLASRGVAFCGAALRRWGLAVVIGLCLLGAAAGAGEAPAAADPLSAAAVGKTLARLRAFGPRAVGERGHAEARRYVGGRLLLAGFKPILTDNFPCPAGSRRAGTRTTQQAATACGSVVAFFHAVPLADRWSDLKSEAEHFTFDRPPRPDLRAALEQAARDEGVDRLTPFDVFKRPSPLFPEAVVRCLLRRLVRQQAGEGADDPRRRAAVMATMLCDLARSHEAVLLAAPLDGLASAADGPQGTDASASLAVLCEAAQALASHEAAQHPRTLVVAALDAHFCGAAGAKSLGRLLGGAPGWSSTLSPGGRGQGEGEEPVLGIVSPSPRPSPVKGEGGCAAADTAEDAQLAALLGPSEAAAQAPAAAQRLERRPEEPGAVAAAENLLVRLLRLEPYRVRAVVLLDLSGVGRDVAATVVTADAGEAKDATAAAASALATPGRPVILLRTQDAAGRTANAGRGGAGCIVVDALAAQARQVVEFVTRRLASPQASPARK